MADYNQNGWLDTDAEWVFVNPAPGDGIEPTPIESERIESSASSATTSTSGIVLQTGLELVGS